MSNKNYRCYHFGNFYLSSIQQGIQSAHAQTNMFLKYDKGQSTHSTVLYEWAKNPTMICLNGGMNSDLVRLEHHLNQYNDKYPFASFREDEDALDSILTNVAIILPDTIYNLSSVIRNNNTNVILMDDQYHVSTDPYTSVVLERWEYEFVTKFLSVCRLAS